MKDKPDHFHAFSAAEQVHFAKEQIGILLLFLFWALIALGMQIIVKWIEANFEVADFYIVTLVWVEKAILIADMIWCLIMLIANTIKLMVRAFFDVKAFTSSIRSENF